MKHIIQPQKEIGPYTIYKRIGDRGGLPLYPIYKDGLNVHDAKRFESARLWVRNQDPTTARKPWRTANRIDGDGCFQEAQKKARFGHRDWIYWNDSKGKHAEVRSPESVKRALLAVGTKGFWSLIYADSGCPSKGFWALGINLLNQMKRGL